MTFTPRQISVADDVLRYLRAAGDRRGRYQETDAIDRRIMAMIAVALIEDRPANESEIGREIEQESYQRPRPQDCPLRSNRGQPLSVVFVDTLSLEK